MTGGHSYGELLALCAADCMSEAALYRLSWERGNAITSIARDAENVDLGGMLAVPADRPRVEQFLNGVSGLWLANHNSR